MPDHEGEAGWTSTTTDQLSAVEDLVKLVPGFQSEWREFLDEWQHEPDIPFYVGMGQLAHYLVESFERGDISELGPFFAGVEKALRGAGRPFENLIAVGLFEDIQNIASHRNFSGEVFIAWLGPESCRLWRETNVAMQRVAQWAVRHYRNHWWQFWRPRRVDLHQILSRVENPELRKMIESNYRKNNKA